MLLRDASRAPPTPTRQIDRRFGTGRTRWVTANRGLRLATVFALANQILLWPARGAAAPEWHAALATGAAWLSEPKESGTLKWCNSLSGHLLFGRSRDSDWGIGPYARLTSAWRSGVSVGAGVSTLLPVSPTYPFILSAGPAMDFGGTGTSPGAEAWLFWGPTSHNFHGSYSMASGVVAGFQRTWGSEPHTLLTLLLQVDLVWFAMPVIVLYETLRGPPQ